MEDRLKKIELFVDKAIPYLLILLVGIVVIDIFFQEISQKYSTSILIIDSIVITFFAADLIFKYRRVRDIPRFLKLYWIDILAVLPFFLVLRLFEEVLLISENSISALRNIFHAGLILEEEVAVGGEAARVLRTSELIAKEGRVALAAEKLGYLERAPRLLKAFSFFEHPAHKKTLYHKKNKSNIIHTI